MANSNFKRFFGFALADSMFAGDCDIRRKSLTADKVKAMAGELTPCLNPSHQATIDAMRSRFGINVAAHATECKPFFDFRDGSHALLGPDLPRQKAPLPNGQTGLVRQYFPAWLV